MSVHNVLFRGNTGRANAHMVDNSGGARNDNRGYSIQYLTDDMLHSFCFMMNERSTIIFPFGDRHALVSIQ